jgi:SAM-dependent methyltransferase
MSYLSSFRRLLGYIGRTLNPLRGRGWREIFRAAGALQIVRPLNEWMRRLAAITHKWQYDMEWRVQPVPEWYDTFLGQYYLWRATRTPWGWDRGVYNVLTLKPGGHVLELCCGGGFFTFHFYSGRAATVVAVDYDPYAIAHACRYNAAANIRYEVMDIRQTLPEGPFDNVVWDGAIEHFTEKDIANLVAQIKGRLAADGTISGYTVQQLRPGMQHPEHEYEFKSKEDLAKFFTPHFRNVLVFETIYAERHNLHFMASDTILPFDTTWPYAFRINRWPL